MAENEKKLGQIIRNSRLFIKNFNSPVWDWTTQRYKGCIIRDIGCCYYDFSCLRPILIYELSLLIQKGLHGNLDPIQELITDLLEGIPKLKCGDLIQLGKSKNRGLFLVSINKLLPITQLLGGNGFGEIPLNFMNDISLSKTFNYKYDYWIYQDHAIINHVPYFNPNETSFNRNVVVRDQLYTIAEGSDFLEHPYIYLDFENKECFTLPPGIAKRFDQEICQIINSFNATQYNSFLKAPPLTSYTTTKSEKIKARKPTKKKKTKTEIAPTKIKEKISIIPKN